MLFTLLLPIGELSQNREISSGPPAWRFKFPANGSTVCAPIGWVGWSIRVLSGLGLSRSNSSPILRSNRDVRRALSRPLERVLGSYEAPGNAKHLLHLAGAGKLGFGCHRSAPSPCLEANFSRFAERVMPEMVWARVGFGVVAVRAHVWQTEWMAQMRIGTEHHTVGRSGHNDTKLRSMSCADNG